MKCHCCHQNLLKNPVHLSVVCYCFSVFSGAAKFTSFREGITVPIIGSISLK